MAVRTEVEQGLHRSGTLGVSHGAALYLGSLIGPGVLLVPALALQAAGPASVIGWAALLVLSAPLALTFAALGARLPVAGGVAAYVRAGFGDAGGAVTGGWFLTAVLLGAPAVSLIGGFYVADLTGGGRGVAAAVGLGMFAVVLLANALGLRLSSRFQLLLAAVLTLVIATAVAVALPSQGGRNWTPFAPHGWWAVGTAANVLVWLFVGWEAVAQLAGEFREPATQLPRAMAVAFGAVTILYVGLAVATVGVSSGSSRVPLADLIGVGFGARGRDATAVLAVALTMGTMNVYLGGAAKLAAAQAERGALPSWLAGDAHRSIPRRPLAVIALIGMLLLGALVAGLGSADGLVRATSACFIAVYVAATASATRILAGAARAAALTAFVLVAVLAVFSAWFLLVPIVSAGVSVALRARLRGRAPEQAAAADETG
ncbi:MAG TPA: amino acid permease [Gaiellaceae bacterium]|nr:amino acid permease [Gaiellaceae bacterium]